MAINQVLIEGALLGEPWAVIDKGYHAHFELLEDGGHIFRCKMWLGHPCHCRPCDRVLAIGHLAWEGGELLIDVISLRKLARKSKGFIEPLRDTPEPVQGRDEIPF